MADQRAPFAPFCRCRHSLYSRFQLSCNENTVPDMEMVAVNKEKASSGTFVAPMMQNLFDESEQQILRALDRGLDNVQQGKVQFTEKTNDSVPNNVRSIKEAIDAEIVTEEEESRVIPSNDEVIMDTTATTQVDRTIEPHLETTFSSDDSSPLSNSKNNKNVVL